jgi:hypothetical protein
MHGSCGASPFWPSCEHAVFPSWNARLPSCISALLGTPVCPPASLRFLARPPALLPLCASWNARLLSCLSALLGTAVCHHASLRFLARQSALMPLCASSHGRLPSCLSALLGTAVCPHASLRFLARPPALLPLRASWHGRLPFLARQSALMPLCASWHGRLPSCLCALLGTAPLRSLMHVLSVSRQTKPFSLTSNVRMMPVLCQHHPTYARTHSLACTLCLVSRSCQHHHPPRLPAD